MVRETPRLQLSRRSFRCDPIHDEHKRRDRDFRLVASIQLDYQKIFVLYSAIVIFYVKVEEDW